jgi:hypothetical protein
LLFNISLTFLPVQERCQNLVPEKLNNSAIKAEIFSSHSSLWLYTVFYRIVLFSSFSPFDGPYREIVLHPETSTRSWLIQCAATEISLSSSLRQCRTSNSVRTSTPCPDIQIVSNEQQRHSSRLRSIFERELVGDSTARTRAASEEPERHLVDTTRGWPTCPISSPSGLVLSDSVHTQRSSVVACLYEIACTSPNVALFSAIASSRSRSFFNHFSFNSPI